MEKDIEEEALKWFIKANKQDIIFDLGWMKIFEAGAKYQKSIMYSEADMLLAFETGRNYQLTGENNFKELIDICQKRN